MRTRMMCSCFSCLLAATGPVATAQGTPTSAPAASPVAATTQPETARLTVLPDPAAVVEEFRKHVQGLGLEPTAREAIDQIWRDQNASDPRDQMVGAIAILSEEYKRALDALDGDKAGAAIEAVQPAAASKDFYVAAHAQTLLARALLEQERLAESQKTLETLYVRRSALMARTFLAPEVLFLLGYCRLHDVDYEGALKVFREFEEQFPEAPEQYRLPVRQMLQEMAGRRPEGLGDVHDLMNYAGRQLKHARANETVQARQARAVELLDKLIEDAQQREQQQQQQQQQEQQQQSGGKSGGAQGAQQPQRGADRSVAPGGQGRVGELHNSGRARPGEQWGKMRPEERERVLQALRQNYPSRYRQLVEQYYRQLSKEE